MSANNSCQSVKYVPEAGTNAMLLVVASRSDARDTAHGETVGRWWGERDTFYPPN